MPDGPPPDVAAAVSAAAVVAAVITAPWLIGASGCYHSAVAAAGLALVAGGLTMRFGAGPVPSAFWPFAGLLVLGAAQALAPVHGAQLETSSGKIASHYLPVSVARSATRETLAVAVLGLLTFVTAARSGGSVASRRTIWWGVTGGAAAFAVVGIVGRLGLWTEAGLMGASDADGFEGPFFGRMNRSHAAQLMNFGLAATLALLATGGGRIAAVCGAIIAAGLVANGSRAGLVAVPIGLALAGGGLLWTSRRHVDAIANEDDSWPAGHADPFDPRRAAWVCAAGVATLVAGVAVSLWQFDLEETGLGRLEESKNRTVAEELSGRWNHWTDAVGVAGDLPLFGAGLGTHRFATPPYQTDVTTGWFTHADNQYVESLVETGAVGVGLLALAIALLARGTARAGRAGAVDAVVAAAYALGAAGVHAGFDYGITRPPVLLAAAALLGTACGAGAATQFRGRLAKSLAILAVLALVVAGGWAARESWLAAPGTPHRELTTVDGDAAEWSEGATAEAIAQLSDAVARRPDDVEVRYVLGRLLIRQYRDEVTAALREDPALAEASDQLIRRLADPGFGAVAAQNAGGEAAVASMRNDPRVKQTLLPAFQHLSAARAACPFVPRMDLHLARVAWASPDEDPTGRRFLAALHRNFPADEVAQAVAAVRAERLGLRDMADDCWRTALSLTPAQAASAAATLSLDRSAPDSPDADSPSVESDGALVKRLASLLPSAPADRAEAMRAIGARFPALAASLAERALGSDLQPLERAVALRLTGDPSGAIEAMRAHLESAPRDLSSRAVLAEWLIDDRAFDEAADQIAILSAIDGDNVAAGKLQKLLERARGQSSPSRKRR